MATMAQAIRLALHHAEREMGVRDIFGQDVGPPLGGVFGVTQGLETAWNTPLDERGIIGTAMGLAMAGQKPICEIQFVDYIFNSIDLMKLAGNSAWNSAGQFPMQMVLMSPTGSGIHGSIYHSHSFEAWAARLNGWKVVMPSDPITAYGLMLAAVEDPNPVLYLIPKALMRVEGKELLPEEPDKKTLKAMIDAPLGDRGEWKPRWPAIPRFITPIGQAHVVRGGEHVSIVSFGRMLWVCLKAAEILQQEGISAEVIDLRSIIPYDWKTISKSILKTGRVMFVNEDTDIVNYGEHLLRRTIDAHFYDLKARPRVLGGEPVPGIGLAETLEDASVPQSGTVVQAARDMMEENT